MYCLLEKQWQPAHLPKMEKLYMYNTHKIAQKNYLIQFLYKIFIHSVLSTGADNAKIWLIGHVKFGIYCGQMYRHPHFPYRGLFYSLKPSK